MRWVVLAIAAFAATAASAPKRQPGAVVIAIDRSGSMQGPKLEAAKAAALATLDALAPDDQIAILVFDSEATLLSKLRPARDRKAIAADLAHLQAGGGTTFVPALQLAFDTLKPLKIAHKHVLFLSDGEAPTDGIVELLKDMRASDITLSAVGVAGADRNLLNMMADAGDGRVYWVEDVKVLPKLFAAEVARALR